MVAVVLTLLSNVEGRQSAVFSARTEAVRVDALVTDKGRPIVGLGRTDFEVLDNGVTQQVDLVSYDEIPLHAVLVLDMSSSVAGERLTDLRRATAALVARLKPQEQAALVTFSHRVNLAEPFTADLPAVLERVQEVAGDGETSLIDAVDLGLIIGQSVTTGRPLLIVFTDGVDTTSWLDPQHVIDLARRLDVLAYVVAVGQPRTAFLRDLANTTAGRLLQIEKTSNLETAFLGILNEARHRHLVSYTPRGVLRPGWHSLEVRVKGRRATVRARPGYFVSGDHTAGDR
jgi:Ca-activated chloride channel family protein